MRLAAGLGELDPAVQEYQKTIFREKETAERDVLGNEGFARLQAFDRLMEPAGLVTDAVGSAVASGLDFSDKQVNGLIAIVSAATDEKTGRIDWHAVDARAARILTPEQIEFFQRAEPHGITGFGGRYQHELNQLITEGDSKDMASPRNPGGGG